MRLRLAAIPAAVIVVIVGLASAPAHANHSWGSFHWARTGPVQVTIVSSLTGGWVGNLVTANNDWNKSPYLENRVVAGATDTTTRRRCAMPSGGIRVCNLAYGQTGWAGLASINTSDGRHISRASAKMNDTYEAGRSAAEHQGVMCQEVGHDFGLAHQDENFDNPNLGTCMDYTSNPLGPPANTHPNSHDYAELDTIYTHLDSANAAFSPAPAAMGEIDFAGPSQWGRVVEK